MLPAVCLRSLMKLQVAMVDHRAFLCQLADRLIGSAQGCSKFLQVGGLYTPLMGQGGQLVQIFTPSAQLRQNWLKFFHYIDRLIQCGLQQVLLLAQAGTPDLGVNLPSLGWGYPEGHHLVSGSRCQSFSPPHKKLVCCRSPSGNDNIPKIFVDSHTKRPELRESYQLQESRSALILFSAVQALRRGSGA